MVLRVESQWYTGQGSWLLLKSRTPMFLFRDYCFKGQIEEGKNSGLRAYLARYGRSGMGTWQKMFQASTFVIWSVVNKRNVATHFVPASTILPLSGFLVALILATFCIQFQIPHLHWATLTVQNVSYDHFLEPWWPHHWWGITMIAALHAIHLASLLPLNAFLCLRRSLFLLSESVAISKCPSTFKCVCASWLKITVSTFECVHASWLNHSLHFWLHGSVNHSLHDRMNRPALTCLCETWHFNILIMII